MQWKRESGEGEKATMRRGRDRAAAKERGMGDRKLAVQED